MTAMELFAKWSVVALVAVGILANIAINIGREKSKPVDGATILGYLIGLLLRAWVIVAVCVWWQP